IVSSPRGPRAAAICHSSAVHNLAGTRRGLCYLVNVWWGQEMTSYDVGPEGSEGPPGGFGRDTSARQAIRGAHHGWTAPEVRQRTQASAQKPIRAARASGTDLDRGTATGFAADCDDRERSRSSFCSSAAQELGTGLGTFAQAHGFGHRADRERRTGSAGS